MDTKTLFFKLLELITEAKLSDEIQISDTEARIKIIDKEGSVMWYRLQLAPIV